MWKTLASSALALSLLTGGVVRADQPAGAAQHFQIGPVQVEIQATPGENPAPWGANAEAAARQSEYWIGVACTPVPPPLRAQLGLPENQGLLVIRVSADSPAQKAGVKEYDVLAKAGDRTLGNLGDLIAAVEGSKGQKLTLDVIRGGKRVNVDVTPAKRPEHAPGQPGENERGEGDWNALQQWLGQMTPDGHGIPRRFRMFGPGAILPANPPLPDNLTISVTRKGSEPAKIVVQQGDKKWEVTDKELDKLPADVRPHVERMLHGPLAMRVMENVPGAVRGWLEAAPEAPQPGQLDRGERPVERQLEQLRRQLDDLRRQMDTLRTPPPGTTPAPQKPNPAPKAEEPRPQKI